MERELAREWIGFVKELAGKYVINLKAQPQFWEAVEAMLVYGENYDVSPLIRGDINQKNRIVLDDKGEECEIQLYGGYGASTVKELLEAICQEIVLFNEIF